jgi:XPG I-region.
LIRGIVSSKKDIINEICLETALKELDLTYEQFVDLCILCGCDYMETIDGKIWKNGCFM